MGTDPVNSHHGTWISQSNSINSTYRHPSHDFKCHRHIDNCPSPEQSTWDWIQIAGILVGIVPTITPLCKPLALARCIWAHISSSSIHRGELSFLQPDNFCICWCDSAILTSYLFRQWLACVHVPNWEKLYSCILSLDHQVLITDSFIVCCVCVCVCVCVCLVCVCVCVCVCLVCVCVCVCV